MERLLQYWDDLDDLVCALALIAERLRRIALFALATALFVSALMAVIYVAWLEPPLALAMTTLLLVTLLYRFTTNPRSPSTPA